MRNLTSPSKSPAYLRTKVENLLIVDGFSEPDSVDMLRAHYSDPPICDAPKSVLRFALSCWSRRSDVFFLVARINGIFAGFVFAQSIGHKPWRELFSDRPLLLPVAVYLWSVGKVKKLLRTVKRITRQASPNTDQVFRSMSTLPSGPQVYDQQTVRSDFARVEFIFVDANFRGKRVAQHLLHELTLRLMDREVSAIHAHIAAANSASIRAFQHAGWEVFRVTGTGLRAFKALK